MKHRSFEQIKQVNILWRELRVVVYIKFGAPY